jgi:hypothetical protein
MKHCAFIHPPYDSQSRSAQLSGPRPVYFTIILKEFEICISGEEEVLLVVSNAYHQHHLMQYIYLLPPVHIQYYVFKET